MILQFKNKIATYLLLLFTLVLCPDASGENIVRSSSIDQRRVTISNQELNELQRLREEKRVCQLIEESVAQNTQISEFITSEVDRRLGWTTGLLNTLLATLTLIPILVGIAIWLLRRSVMRHLVSEIGEDVKAEYHKAVKLQSEKEQVIQQLSLLGPYLQDEIATAELEEPEDEPPLDPETRQSLNELSSQLGTLRENNPQLQLTARDYWELGRANNLQERYDEAVEQFKMAVELNPNFGPAWFGWGKALHRMKKYEAALDSFSKALRFNSDPVHTRHWQGLALRRLERYDEAIDTLEKATELNPQYSPAWYNKACYYALKGDQTAAIENLQKTVELSPTKYKVMAETDPDFDSIRGCESFQKLISE